MGTEAHVGLMIGGCGEAGKQESSKSPWFLACTASYAVMTLELGRKIRRKKKKEFLALLTGFEHKLDTGTLCNPMDCSPPGSSVYGILQARILEWQPSRASSQARDGTSISCLLFL